MVEKRLQDLREERFWTQTQVAETINISQRAYSHYERGTRQVPLTVLVQLAALYEVSLDYIVGLTDDPTIYYSHDFEK